MQPFMKFLSIIHTYHNHKGLIKNENNKWSAVHKTEVVSLTISYQHGITHYSMLV